MEKIFFTRFANTYVKLKDFFQHQRKKVFKASLSSGVLHRDLSNWKYCLVAVSRPSSQNTVWLKSQISISLQVCIGE